jgi:hypothetical protein
LKAVLAGRFRGDEIADKGFVNSIYTHSLATLVDRAEGRFGGSSASRSKICR